MPYKIIQYRRNQRAKFYREYKREAQDYDPQHVVLPAHSTIFAKVNVGRAIREAARRGVQITFLYKKIGYPEGSIEYYQVTPVSYKFMRLRVGVRKVLYAWDEERLPHQMRKKPRMPGRYTQTRKVRGSIKTFVVANILNCHITDKPRSRWTLRYRVTIP